MTRFVVGDIHGCAKALRTLLHTIAPTADDEVVFLGDYVDRGPDSPDVVEQLLELETRCDVVALRGNHELMLLGVALCDMDPETWLRSGGRATVTSYGGTVQKIPMRHLEFFQRTRPHYETESHIFVHAMYDPATPMDLQSDELTYWAHLQFPLPGPHVSGKRVFVGHTPQGNGDVLLLPHLACLDTYCFGGGYLTAMNLDDGSLVQVDRHGHLRKVPIARLAGGLAVGLAWCGRWLFRGHAGQL